MNNKECFGLPEDFSSRVMDSINTKIQAKNKREERITWISIICLIPVVGGAFFYILSLFSIGKTITSTANNVLNQFKDQGFGTIEGSFSSIDTQISSINLPLILSVVIISVLLITVYYKVMQRAINTKHN